MHSHSYTFRSKQTRDLSRAATDAALSGDQHDHLQADIELLREHMRITDDATILARGMDTIALLQSRLDDLQRIVKRSAA
jgi:hypothetical protein